MERSPRSSAEDGKMNINDVKDLIDMIDQANINEVQVETAGMRVAIRKGILGNTDVSEQKLFKQDSDTVEVDTVEADTVKAETDIIEEEAVDKTNLIEVTAPMVGTFIGHLLLMLLLLLRLAAVSRRGTLFAS